MLGICNAANLRHLGRENHYAMQKMHLVIVKYTPHVGDAITFCAVLHHPQIAAEIARDEKVSVMMRGFCEI